MKLGWQLLTALMLVAGTPFLTTFFDVPLGPDGFEAWGKLCYVLGLSGSTLLAFTAPSRACKLVCAMLSLCFAMAAAGEMPPVPFLLAAVALLLVNGWLFHSALGLDQPRLPFSPGCMLGLVIIPPLWLLLMLAFYLAVLVHYLGPAWNGFKLEPSHPELPELPESVVEDEPPPLPSDPVIAESSEDDSDWTSHR